MERSKIDAIVTRTLELPSNERESFLYEVCGDDDPLRQSVIRTLAQKADDKAVAEVDLHPGDRVGPYQILEPIGEGGMGSVFLAEQREPVERKVALKVVKLGMDTKDLLARFDAERQALALMSHPNVAAVHEAGATATGRPYFAMEYVPGIPINEYCDQQRLTIDQRVDLFKQACIGVHHAHQKGLIHRDLKPTNILVTEKDGRAVLKIIDFGIAKSTQRKLTAHTLHTQLGVFIGTPDYTSPEQAQRDAHDIDTRSDIYSLGVVLYELLVGRAPFDRRTFAGKSLQEIQQIIREVEPPSLSMRFDRLGNSREEVARRRSLEPSRVRRRLEGELSWIVLRAMEKDRNRRYPSASELADELDRYLGHLPVTARAPGGLYRARKFVRRNRLAVSLAGLIGLLLIATTAVSTILYLRSERFADEAKASAEEANRIAEFQAKQLSEINPHTMGRNLRTAIIGKVRSSQERQGLETGAVDANIGRLEEMIEGANFTDLALELLDENIFDSALTAIDKDFDDQPLIQARLWQTVADTLFVLGRLERATEPQQRALETRRRVLGDEHPDTLASINRMGVLLQELGKYAEAEPYFREALDTRRRVLDPEHPDTLTSINNMGEVLDYQGRFDEAMPYYLEVIGPRRRVLGNEHRDTLTTINNIALLIQAQGNNAEAEPYYREALEGRRRALGDEHPDTLISVNNMGFLLQAQGKIAEAEPYFREALETRRRLFGDEHPDTLHSISNLGYLLAAQGHLAEAEPYYREALESRRRVLGNEHWYTLISMNHMASLLRSQGKLDEAESMLRQALQSSRNALGEQHTQTLRLLYVLGDLQRLLGNLNEALVLSGEATSRTRSALGDHHGSLGLYLTSHGRNLIALERFEEAGKTLEESYAILSHPETGDGRYVAGSMKALVGLYDAWHEKLPDQGYDIKAAEWRNKLVELEGAEKAE